MISRRRFFSRAALTAGSAAVFPHLGRSAESIRDTPGQKPGAIIHLVADGMSAGTFTCGDYLSHFLRRREMKWTELMKSPGARLGYMNMRSINSMVTDSSAASSSWGSGSRVPNGALNQLPSGKLLTPLYTLFSQQGWKRGLVTTTEITHATPAGFAASMASRDNAPEIASQYLQRRVEVLLGGGRKFFTPEGRKDNRDLNAEFAAAGYLVMNSCNELAQAQLDRPWLGTFSDSHLPYTIDWLADPALQRRVPHLATMTRRALEWLGRHDHFVLQVEGGRVDHGAHNCDAPAALRDLLAFDEALEVALEFQKQRPDTLIVVTTDHGNGNMGVNGSGSGYLQSSSLFRNVAEAKASFGEILRQVKAAPGQTVNGTKVASEKEIRDILEATTGYRAPQKRAALFQSFLAKETTCLYDGMNSETAQLGQLLANHFAVGWAGGAHTADYVPLTAMGPGAERFTGFVQNTEVFRNYTLLANIDFRNPEEPLIGSAQHAATEVENVAEYAVV